MYSATHPPQYRQLVAAAAVVSIVVIGFYSDDISDDLILVIFCQIDSHKLWTIITYVLRRTLHIILYDEYDGCSIRTDTLGPTKIVNALF